ncbi:MAG: T9SS type A sorting domain-containing protein, partial [Bacteroidota bacterium]
GLYLIKLDYGFDHHKVNRIVKGCDANFLDTVTIVEKTAVYPNPVESEIIIETSGTSMQQFEIIDISGRVLQQTNSETQNEIINMNVSWLHPGIYFISILQADGKVDVMKIV